MVNGWTRQPDVAKSQHPLPGQSGFLRAPSKGLVPSPHELGSKALQGLKVSRHPIITIVTTQNSSQVLANSWDFVMHSPTKYLTNLFQLLSFSFGNGSTINREHTIAVLHSTDVA